MGIDSFAILETYCRDCAQVLLPTDDQRRIVRETIWLVRKVDAATVTDPIRAYDRLVQRLPGSTT